MGKWSLVYNYLNCLDNSYVVVFAVDPREALMIAIHNTSKGTLKKVRASRVIPTVRFVREKTRSTYEIMHFYESVRFFFTHFFSKSTHSFEMSPLCYKKFATRGSPLKYAITGGEGVRRDHAYANV